MLAGLASGQETTQGFSGLLDTGLDQLQLFNDSTSLEGRRFVGATWESFDRTFELSPIPELVSEFVQVSGGPGRAGLEFFAGLEGQTVRAMTNATVNMTFPTTVVPGQTVRISARPQVDSQVMAAVTGPEASVGVDLVGRGSLRGRFGGSDLLGNSFDSGQIDIFNADFSTRLAEIGPGQSINFPLDPTGIAGISGRTPAVEDLSLGFDDFRGNGLRQARGTALGDPVLSFDTDLDALFSAVAGLPGVSLGFSGPSGDGIRVEANAFGVSADFGGAASIGVDLVNAEVRQGFGLRQEHVVTLSQFDVNFDQVTTSAGNVTVIDVLGNNGVFTDTGEFDLTIPAGVAPGEVITIAFNFVGLFDASVITSLVQQNQFVVSALGLNAEVLGFELVDEALFEASISGTGPGVVLGSDSTPLSALFRGSFQLTVVPAPGVLVTLVGASVLACRRRRG
jgi:hypothetical protein